MHIAQYHEILGEEDPYSGSQGGCAPDPSGTPNIMVELTHLFRYEYPYEKVKRNRIQGPGYQSVYPGPVRMLKLHLLFYDSPKTTAAIVTKFGIAFLHQFYTS